MGSIVVALYLGFSNRGDTTTIRRTIVASGTPCVRLANGKPSKGCDRLARLLIQTCVLRPSLCAEVVEKTVAAAPPAVRSKIITAVGRGLEAPPPKRKKAPAKKKGIPGDLNLPGGGPSGGGDTPTPTAPITPAAPQTPEKQGSTTTPTTPGTTTRPVPPEQQGPTPAKRPSPSEVANDTTKRVQDTVNDVTGSIGAGEPVPTLPQVPPLPQLPPVVPVLPCIQTPVTTCP